MISRMDPPAPLAEDEVWAQPGPRPADAPRRPRSDDPVEEPNEDEDPADDREVREPPRFPDNAPVILPPD